MLQWDTRPARANKSGQVIDWPLVVVAGVVFFGYLVQAALIILDRRSL